MIENRQRERPKSTVATGTELARQVLDERLQVRAVVGRERSERERVCVMNAGEEEEGDGRTHASHNPKAMAQLTLPSDKAPRRGAGLVEKQYPGTTLTWVRAGRGWESRIQGPSVPRYAPLADLAPFREAPHKPLARVRQPISWQPSNPATLEPHRLKWSHLTISSSRREREKKV